jgi:hypothetical protein
VEATGAEAAMLEVVLGTEEGEAAGTEEEPGAGMAVVRKEADAEMAAVEMVAVDVAPESRVSAAMGEVGRRRERREGSGSHEESLLRLQYISL